jgi:hypothetical protein
MDTKDNWISLTVGTLLCGLSGVLLLVLIADCAQSHNNPETQSHSINANVLVALRLVR